MNFLKKFFAGMLAAVMMSVSCVPAVYAEYDAQSAEESDAVPEFELATGKIFEMSAGTKALVPISLRLKRSGSYSEIVVKLTGGSSDVQAEEQEKIIGSDSLSTGFIITASPTAAQSSYDFTVSATIYKNGSAVGTQTFPIKVKVKSDLQVKGLNIESYSVSKTGIKAGDKFSITVILKNNSGIDVKSAELFLDGIDTTKFVLDNGFSKQYVDIPNGKTGAITYNLIAQKGIKLERENLTLTLSYSLDSSKSELSRQTSTQVILNCVPEESEQEAKYGAHDLAMTGYTVSSTSVEKGTKFELNVTVKNNGKEEIKRARVAVTPDGTKFAVESGLSYNDFDIKPGETKRLTFKLIGGTGITAERENVPIEIEFGSNKSTVQAAISCKPEPSAEKNGKYDITMSNYNVSVPNVAENTPFTLTVTVHNSSKKKIESARINLQNLDGSKFAMDTGLPFYDFDIESGESKTFTFQLIGCKGIASVREVISVEINYGEITNTSYATVACVPKEEEKKDETKTFAPTIIIESYDFGGEYVTAGQQFPLNLVIKNASANAVIDNLKVTINGVATKSDGAVAYSPANSSNSFFFENLGIHETKNISMDILARSDATPNSYPLEISFTYEYTVKKDHYQANPVSENITIPLRQEDRLEIGEPENPNYPVPVGTPVTINVNLVNKGKSDTFNVSAEVSGEGFTVETPKYYVGNIKSGVEEIYDAKITPTQAGGVTGTILFTYEDANGSAKSKEVEFSFDSMEESFGGMDMSFEGMYEDVPEQEPVNIWLFVGIGAAVLVAVIIIIVVIVKHAKKKKAEAEDDDEDL
ncbi:MAG: hypothetical protein IK990_08370 [Ruminiclostridium sp.]|nr:hypothetical protein [Ruminiclostridium sp.]